MAGQNPYYSGMHNRDIAQGNLVYSLSPSDGCGSYLKGVSVSRMRGPGTILPTRGRPTPAQPRPS